MPKLRFPGFEGEWGVALLSEIFEKNTQKNADGKITNVICNSAKQGLIPQREYFDKDIANGDNTNAYYIIKQNDFVYNPRKSSDAPYGPISIYKYADAGIVSPLYLCFSAKHRINSRYFEWYFRSPVWHRYIYISGDSGARHDRVSIKDSTFFAMPICIPSGHEQMQIASFLSKLDERIEKQRLLVENIKKYKRGLLSTMFPEKGEAMPKYRFSGFAEPWEQRKLGDTLCSLQNNTLSRAELTYEKGAIKNVHYGDILVKYGEVLDVKNEQIPNIIDTTVAEKYKASFLQNGDVIFADTAEDDTVGKCSEIAGMTDETVLSGLHTMPYRPRLKFATGYLGYYLNASAFHQQLIPLMQGIKVTSISKSAMQNTDIVYPKSFEEQEKIGAYFMHLDHLITLYQRKLDISIKIKSGLLQQLFI